MSSIRESIEAQGEELARAREHAAWLAHALEEARRRPAPLGAN